MFLEAASFQELQNRTSVEDAGTRQDGPTRCQEQASKPRDKLSFLPMQLANATRQCYLLKQLASATRERYLPMQLASAIR